MQNECIALFGKRVIIPKTRKQRHRICGIGVKRKYHEYRKVVRKTHGLAHANDGQPFLRKQDEMLVAQLTLEAGVDLNVRRDNQ